MPLEKQSLNNFLPDGFETNNLEGYKENFSADKIATGYEKDVKDRVSGPNFNNLLDVLGKNTNVLTNFMDFIKNMPINNIFVVDENNQLAYKPIDEVGGGGLEIGDIGIAPLGIDESKGKRRYLNGQIIIQEQYAGFTKKVKDAINLYPSLACSESDWQATALLTVGGQVGKFVVDNDAGTIRLPKIIMPIQGLTDLSKLAEIVEAGLPNITGYLMSFENAFSDASGAISISGTNGGANYHNSGSTNMIRNINFNASKSNPIYGNSNTVQPEAIQYPYFIQIATGSETKAEIINEIELNNPHSLGDSKYSPVALNNISWLKSEGQYNPKGTYPAYYDWLLRIYNGTEVVEGVSVKLVTEEYTDYDFVLNTADETFRLPLLDGSEDLFSDKSISLTLQSSGSNYTAPANGWYIVSCTGAQSIAYTYVKISKSIVTSNSSTLYSSGVLIPVSKDTEVKIQYGGGGSSLTFVYAEGNGSLYYYVGETVQNAHLINAGRIGEVLPTKVDMQQATVASFPSSRYVDLTLGANGATYTAPANGYFYVDGNGTNTHVNFKFNVNGVTIRQDRVAGNSNCAPIGLVAARKGESVIITYTTSSLSAFRFIYAEGEQ